MKSGEKIYLNNRDSPYENGANNDANNGANYLFRVTLLNAILHAFLIVKFACFFHMI
jgi:hypothetical protein